MPAPRDPVFQKALKNHRVLSVHQELVGTKKDHGLVGFSEGPHAQYLIFPKSLRRFADRRVIGIDYELLAARKETPASSARARKTSAAKTEKNSPTPPKKTNAPRNAAGNVVPFERIEKPVRAPKPKQAKPFMPPVEPAPTLPRVAANPAEIARTIDRTLKELKAGKAVAAYERLLALQQKLRKSAE